MQPVGELDQDDPHIGGHRHHHLAVVLGLALVARSEGEPGQLGDAVDQARDLIAECLLDLVEACARVLDGVVQQGGAKRLRVETQPGAYLRHLERVDHEVLPGAPALVGVLVGGEGEGSFEQLAVDLLLGGGAVLADHGEQVAEQGAFGTRHLLGDGVRWSGGWRGDGAYAHPGVAAPIRPGNTRAVAGGILYIRGF